MVFYLNTFNVTLCILGKSVMENTNYIPNKTYFLKETKLYSDNVAF